MHALRGVSLNVQAGEMLAIMGPSGSGKSTMMNILGALDVPTSGTYMLDGQNVAAYEPGCPVRGAQPQDRLCLSELQPAAPHVGAGQRRAAADLQRRQQRPRALHRCTEMVGLGDRLHHRPNELSGGQQQRVAIARALVNQPSIILADEPTGNLDSKAGEEVMHIFQELNEKQGITIMFVTHEADIAEHTRRIVRLQDGRIASDTPVLNPKRAASSALAPAGRKPRDTGNGIKETCMKRTALIALGHCCFRQSLCG